jgi:hypothetical protein
MACCKGDARMKDLNHVRVLAQIYANGEGINEIVIFETNVPPVGKAYDFEPAAYGRKDIVETVRLSVNTGSEVLSDNVGRKPTLTRKERIKTTEKVSELGSGGAEVLGDSGELLS